MLRYVSLLSLGYNLCIFGNGKEADLIRRLCKSLIVVFASPPKHWFLFSGSLICYEFLSPLTPPKVFSWRSWQIESDRQTGSSVRPQESHSSRAVSPSIHHWSRALIAWLSVASKAVSPSGPFTVLSAPWKRMGKAVIIKWAYNWEKRTRLDYSATTSVYT